jgi:hypothetical protein
MLFLENDCVVYANYKIGKIQTKETNWRDQLNVYNASVVEMKTN